MVSHRVTKLCILPTEAVPNHCRGKIRSIFPIGFYVIYHYNISTDISGASLFLSLAVRPVDRADSQSDLSTTY